MLVFIHNSKQEVVTLETLQRDTESSCGLVVRETGDPWFLSDVMN